MIIIAILVCTLFSVILGSIWYSPMAFGKIWISELKPTKEQIEEAQKKGMAKEYTLTLVASLISAIILYYMIAITSTTLSAICLGLLIWAGFYVGPQLNPVLWEGKSWKMYLVNVGYYLIQILGMCLIITFLA